MTPVYSDSLLPPIRRLPDALFRHQLESLNQRDQTFLLQTCTFAYVQVVQARKHLDLTSSLLTDDNLAKSIAVFPNVKSIHLCHLEKVTGNGIRTLTPLVQTRAFTQISVEQLQRVEVHHEAWIDLLRATNFSAMQIFHMPDLFPPYASFFPILIEKVSTNQVLRIIHVSGHLIAQAPELAISLIEHLPPTLTALDFPRLEVSGAIAAILMRRFNPEIITSCELRFPKKQITEEELLNFLHFLPLQQMKKIFIVGNGLTNPCFHYISTELRKNSVLEILCVHNLSISNYELLVQSIQSPKLKTLRLSTNPTPFFNHLILKKLSLWKNIETLEFMGRPFTPPKPLILTDASELFRTEASLKEITPPSDTERELFALIEELIQTFESTPTQAVIDHYLSLLEAVRWGLPKPDLPVPIFTDNLLGLSQETTVDFIRRFEEFFLAEYNQRFQSLTEIEQTEMETRIDHTRIFLSKLQTNEMTLNALFR